MPQLKDPEFGTINLRRTAFARSIRLKMDSRGAISISMPRRASLRAAKQLLEQSRIHLRQLLDEAKRNQKEYTPGQLIGKSHRLRFSVATDYRAALRSAELVVYHPPNPDPQRLQLAVHSGIKKALRQQAQAYLPQRLQHLAQTYDFQYANIRLSSAGTRWGSCSTTGTISLNIWLMQLPFELIDYVLVHELCHTKHMNHSDRFWKLVEYHCPNYRQNRLKLKQFQPYA